MSYAHRQDEAERLRIGLEGLQHRRMVLQDDILQLAQHMHGDDPCYQATGAEKLQKLCDELLRTCRLIYENMSELERL